MVDRAEADAIYRLFPLESDLLSIKALNLRVSSIEDLDHSCESNLTRFQDDPHVLMP